MGSCIVCHLEKTGRMFPVLVDGKAGEACEDCVRAHREEMHEQVEKKRARCTEALDLEAIKNRWPSPRIPPSRPAVWPTYHQACYDIRVLVEGLEAAIDRIGQLEKEPREEAEYLGKEYGGNPRFWELYLKLKGRSQ